MLGEVASDVGAPRETCAQPVLVDLDHADDAAVVGHADGQALVLTADVIAPLVDDAEAFGAIAACNSLSDVWAMGGQPRFALNLMFFPDDALPRSVLVDILRGGSAVCRRAGVAIVGGHTVRDQELKYGLSVTGEVAPGAVLSNRTARPGQALVLSKALGTGVIGQAIKGGHASAAEIAAAVASMTLLNQGALAIGRDHGVTACTDVTGFGLLGHLRNLVRGSGVTATIALGALPLLPGAELHLRAGRLPGGSKANRRFLAGTADPAAAPGLLRWADGGVVAAELEDLAGASVAEVRLALACDAQTSGGLLLCVPADRAAACERALSASGHAAAVIGHLDAPMAGAGPAILVA